MFAAIPFEVLDWDNIPGTEHVGEKGMAICKEVRHGSLRIRLVEYTPGYRADHWCSKGHILFCIDGEMLTELKDGRTFLLKKGMSYHVSDGLSVHRSSSKTGVRLLIVDGGFLQT
jgi:hypothetical protein